MFTPKFHAYHRLQSVTGYVLVSSEQCKLYCSVRGIQPNYYKMNDKVEDGTRCTKNGPDICVNGKCKVR